MKRYFYKEKGYYYFGFDYNQDLLNEIKNRFKGSWNPANFEWYVKAEIWNIGILNKFIEENKFKEAYPERERDVKLSPIREKISIQDVKLLIPELNLKRIPRDYQIEGIHYMLNHGNCINGSDVGLGKAQPLDMKIPTPKGLVNFGDLKSGDIIFGSDGYSQKIEAVYPQGIKDCYKVTFTDGSSVECCDEHFWSVRAWKQTNPLQVITLKEIMNAPLRGKSCNNTRIKGHESKGYWKWKLPIIKNPIEFEERKILLDPYTLGFLIGDGCLRRNPKVSCADKEILTYLKFPEGCFLKKTGEKLDYNIIDSISKRQNRVKKILEQYNLMEKYSYEKEIPEDYIYNKKEIRLAVLQGILDSDGYISKSGLIEFSCTSKKLIEQVGFIVKSLGGVHNPIRIKRSHYINSKKEKVECREHYRIGINLPSNIIPCRLKRKRDLLIDSKKIAPNRSICKVEYIGKKEMQCIRVSNSDALYVCGEDCLLTHNTAQTIIYLELLDLFPCIIVCPSTVKEGWKKEWSLWNPNRSLSIINSGKKQNWEADVIVINYDLLGKFEEKKLLNKVKKQVIVKFPELIQNKYYAIVGDEIHLLKNRQAMRSQAFIQIASKINTRIGLSGTIIMNRPSELKNVLKFLGRFTDIFPDSNYFDFRYCNAKVTEFGRDVSCCSNIEELHLLLRHYCYFRKEKREVLNELPPITEQLIEMKISNKKVYTQAEEDLINYLEKVNPDQIEKALRADQLVQLNVLFQLSVEGKQKQMIVFIKEWMEANEDEKLIVFGIHKKPLIEMAQQIENSCLITGDLSLSKKMKVKEEFITDPNTRILFANIQCIGTGVDGLQEACSNALIIELPMKPSDLVQAIGRLERMGQKSNINIYYLLSTETIDMKIWKLLKEKKEVADTINKGFVDDVSLELISSYRDTK